MWIEFFIYGIVLSGTLRVYQNTGGRGSFSQLPLWMQNQWVSILVSLYGLTIFLFIALAFISDGFAGLLNIISLVLGSIIGLILIPPIIGNLLFIGYPLFALYLGLQVLNF